MSGAQPKTIQSSAVNGVGMDGPNVLKQWQMEETKNALAEADRGDFASEEQVRLAIKP
jgi:predicted transcriptional regulator